MKQLTVLTLDRQERMGTFHFTLMVDDKPYEFTATYEEGEIAGVINFKPLEQLFTMLPPEAGRAYWRLFNAIRSLYETGTMVELPYDLDAD